MDRRETVKHGTELPTNSPSNATALNSADGQNKEEAKVDDAPLETVKIALSPDSNSNNGVFSETEDQDLENCDDIGVDEGVHG